MVRAEKQKKVEELQDKISKSKCCVLTEYRGLSVQDIDSLRGKIRGIGGEYHVVKNTLTSIASKRIGLDGLETHLKGPTAMVLGYENESSVAKILFDFNKKFNSFKIKAGVLDGVNIIDANMLKRLSMLPGKDVLLLQLIGSIKGTLLSFVNVLQANLQSMVSVINELKLQKEGGKNV